jgi:hypothetical protein
MRQFLRYLTLLFVMIAFSWTTLPRWLNLEFPRQPGPEFDKQARKTYTTLLEEERSDIILLGDSTLMDGVDPELLTELTRKKVSSFHIPGSSSALWYIILKNNIIVAEHHPQAVAIIFRDTMLTAPGYRVHGAYFSILDEFATPQEPVLLEKSYLNLMNPLEIWSEKYFPLYSARDLIRKKIDSSIRYTASGWVNCDIRCTDDSMYNVFTSADLETGQLRNAVATAESYLYTPSQLDFDKQVEKSYLPEIIRLAREQDIQLILVRLKNQTTGNKETFAIKKYMADLSDYLRARNVIFLDYGQDSRLSSEYFGDTLHLNRVGKAVFTHILADNLNEVLK